MRPRHFLLSSLELLYLRPMDVLRKELDTIYQSQNLGSERLDKNILRQCKEIVSVMASTGNACWVITDVSADCCFIYGGAFARLLGLTDGTGFYREIRSSDEDMIYNRLHPEDLVEKRMLEYEFFKFVDRLEGMDKRVWKATCRLRVLNCRNEYMYVENSTRVMQESPNGKMWLILCGYDIAREQGPSSDISPKIVCNDTGEVISVSLSDKRRQILTSREKEILNLIKEGKLSKEIAGLLGISVHTVNRHRQNILEKLCVGNSLEAVMAAEAMKVL